MCSTCTRNCRSQPETQGLWEWRPEQLSWKEKNSQKAAAAYGLVFLPKEGGNWWFRNKCTASGGYVPCIYSNARCLLIAFVCSAILHSRADSLRSHVILRKGLFIARFGITTQVLYLQHWHGWCHMKLLPSRRVPCTPYNHVPCHFMQSHKRKVHACLVVTCHLHFSQNENYRGWIKSV